ncbi:cysteine-rich CWC family protein [Methylomonas methanica]|nr:cysteine-rich CWC family protein [Methylomonas methanica]
MRLLRENIDSKHEAKLCPRCQREFICKANRIHCCDCSSICLSFETSEYIRQRYEECLCTACLQELAVLVTSQK